MTTSYIRLGVLMFADRMEQELSANERKGSFEEWRPHVEELINEIEYHLSKLKIELRQAYRNQDRIEEYAADTANLLMKATHYP